MGCALEFPESSVKVNFCSKGNNQKMVIDILTKHGEIDMDRLAFILEVPLARLKTVCSQDSFLVGEPADSLTQLFLTFLAKHFFQNCTLIRNFAD